LYVPFAFAEVGEELPQVVIVRRLEEVQATHVAQIRRHLLGVVFAQHLGELRESCHEFHTRRIVLTSIGVARLVSPIFW